MQTLDLETTSYVLTSGAVTATITSVPMAEDTVGRIRCIILARSDTGYSSTWFMDYAFEHDTGVSVLGIGTGTKSKMGSFNAANWDASVVANGNYIDIKGTGDTGDVIKWSISGQIHFYQHV